MDGIQFLQQVRDMAPDTVRMMLSGNADMASAVNAINRGRGLSSITGPR
jgi:ActR/RegA family two-component response regulator